MKNKISLVIALIFALISTSFGQVEKHTDYIVEAIIEDYGYPIIQTVEVDSVRIYIVSLKDHNEQTQSYRKYIPNHIDVYEVELFLENYEKYDVNIDEHWEYKLIEYHNGYYAKYCFHNEEIRMIYHDSIKLLVFEIDLYPTEKGNVNLDTIYYIYSFINIFIKI